MAHDTLKYDLASSKGHSLLEQALIQKVKAYLRNKALEEVEKDIEDIAIEAVKAWSEFSISQSPDLLAYDTNINIQFVEKVIRTEMKDHPIQITVNSNKGNKQ